MALFKRIVSSPTAQAALGSGVAAYLRLVWNTSHFVLEPADFRATITRHAPIIATMWHGQHFMMPFVKPRDYPAKVMISRHRDGEINAIAASKLGLGIIRASGATDGRFDRKGGVYGFKALLSTLKDGISVAVTADVPKVSRVAGAGVALLARASSRPVIPVGMATSRRITLDNWDKSAVNMPFSRGALVLGDPIWVPADARDDNLEVWRRKIEDGLNAAHDRAYAIADRTSGP